MSGSMDEQRDRPPQVALWIAKHLYLVTLASTALMLWMAWRGQWPLAALSTGLGLATLLFSAWLERRAPYRSEWLQSQRGESRIDAASAFTVAAMVDPLLKAAVALATAIPPWVTSTSFAAWDPGWLLAATWLWIEFAKYWMHRWHHAFAPLWALHAMHHNATRLYWLNGLRIHPLNHAFNSLAANLPLALLGVPDWVLMSVAVVTTPLMLLQHVNVDTRSGWLNRVLSTNEAHRWHHSAQPEQANANFGSTLLIWDHLFGTYAAAATRSDSDVGRVGLFPHPQRPPFEGGYLQQLWRGITMIIGPRCCARA